MSFVDDMNTVMDTLRDEALVSAYDIIKDADAKIAELQAEVEKAKETLPGAKSFQINQLTDELATYKALVPSSTDPLATLRDAVEFCVWSKDSSSYSEKEWHEFDKKAMSVVEAAKKEPSNG